MPSRCIGVFGLSVHTTQHRIREIFSKYGPIERIQVVIDAQVRREDCRAINPAKLEPRTLQDREEYAGKRKPRLLLLYFQFFLMDGGDTSPPVKNCVLGQINEIPPPL